MAINQGTLAGFAKLIVFTTIFIDMKTFANLEKYSHSNYATIHVQAHGASEVATSTRPLYGPMNYIDSPISRLDFGPVRSSNLVLDPHGSDYTIHNEDDHHQDYRDNHHNDGQIEDINGELNNEYTDHEVSSSPSSSSSQSHERPELSEKYNSLPDEKIHLNRRFVKEICELDRGSQRTEKLNDTYLNYCTRYKLENLLSSEILMSVMHKDSKECEHILDEFIQLDELINQFDHLFTNLLKRYNCNNGYSVKWNCEDCKKAYKDWICATTLPFYTNGERIKPCLSFCERVEQRCPYLHPITKEQYGGQPLFICRDPNIPFVPEITPDIPFSEPGKCYDLCHLSDNKTELSIDSLSKYEYSKCPDKGSIAERVSIIKESNSASDGTEAAGPTLEDVDHFDEDPAVPINRTTSAHGEHRPPFGQTNNKRVHVHNKKLDHLREVLTVYKNQPKTHRFGHHAEHAAIVPPSRSHFEIHSS